MYTYNVTSAINPSEPGYKSISLTKITYNSPFCD